MRKRVLDVYKRQALAALAVIGIMIAALWFWISALMGKIQKDPHVNIEEMTNPNIDAVSYTHLDVSKRQPSDWLEGISWHNSELCLW